MTRRTALAYMGANILQPDTDAKYWPPYRPGQYGGSCADVITAACPLDRGSPSIRQWACGAAMRAATGSAVAWPMSCDVTVPDRQRIALERVAAARPWRDCDPDRARVACRIITTAGNVQSEGSPLRRRRHEAVAYAAHRQHMPGFRRIVLDVAAQPHDEIVNRARVGVFV